jgi:hypothetical protein
MLLYVLFNKVLVFVQNISFAFGGLFMKFFVNRSDMWWPCSLGLSVLEFELSCVLSFFSLYLKNMVALILKFNVGQSMRTRKYHTQVYQEDNFSSWSLSLVFPTTSFQVTSSLQSAHYHLFAGFGKGLSLLNNLVLVSMVWGLVHLALIGRQLVASLEVL